MIATMFSKLKHGGNRFTVIIMLPFITMQFLSMYAMSSCDADVQLFASHMEQGVALTGRNTPGPPSYAAPGEWR